MINTPEITYADLHYDGYLPELPPGWPNITIPKPKGNKNKSLSVRPRGDISIRDDPVAFKRYATLAVSLLSVSVGAVSFYGLVQSCAQFTQQTGNGVQCVFAAIGEVISIVTLVYQGAVWRGQLAQRLTNNGWHIVGINKRDEWTSLMARGLSVDLNTEVRHLGTWDPSKSTQKRDSPNDVPREVFGIQAGGHDFHFTYMGRDPDGKETWKIGLGDGGPQLLDNHHTKERRQAQIKNGNFYFTSGGIDFAAQSVESASAVEWTWGSPDDAVEFGEIYNSIACYLKDGSGGATTLQTNNALSFQVYDSFAEYTISAGVMSPFSADHESAIRSLSIGGGIGCSSCGTF
ncbi:hypothetical protein ONZ43_g7116 [Nemania bipapillata]|uniref:Uncharacterized protein n=1 Tax=Nemania bipapillata TaxID=110536 RepID=A0ACC2HUS8_9PEZI|nr:hypothetical protein ONZ43_g7116 [Nemania bipapillata]